MHIDKKYLTNDGISVNPAAVIDIINNINNGVSTDAYPGIAMLTSMFRNATTNDQFIDLWYPVLPAEQQYQMNRDINSINLASNPDNGTHSRYTQFIEMDWYQQFCLAHLYTAELDRFSTLVDWVMIPTSSPVSGYLRLYDLMCTTAITNYNAKLDVRAVRRSLIQQNEMLRRDAQYIINRTVESDGCDAGKMEFLNSIEFIDSDDWADKFEHEISVRATVEYEITFSMTVPANVDNEEYASDYLNEIDLSDYITINSPDDVTIDHVEEA